MLITGAGGFVGSHLAQGFLALGDAVTGLDLAFDTPTRRRLAGTRLVEAALTGQGLAGLGRFDLVIHGAALTSIPAGMGEAAYIAANVGLLAECLDFASASGARDFVFLSSSGVFAPEDGDGVHVESTPPTSTAPYALAKRAGEVAILAANSPALRAIAVRLGPIYGPAEIPRGTRLAVSQVRLWLDAIEAGEAIVVDEPGTVRDWTFAPDLGFALDALLRLDLSGVVHLTAAQFVTNRDLAEAMVRVAGRGRMEIGADGPAPRRPMASDRVDLHALYGWTRLETGLARTLATEALS